MSNQLCKWSVLPAPKRAELDSFMDTGLSRLAAITLLNRGVSPTALRTHMDSPLSALPDPFLLHDMDKAASAFADAIECSLKSDKHATCYGDYDADGVLSSAIICRFGRMLGVEIGVYIPHRVTEGYGLSDDGIRQLAANGTRFVVSVDSGISAHAEAKLAKELGIKLVITDHHKPGETLPDAVAVVDPHIKGCRYPFKPLAGVGVAFNLVIATRKVLRDRGWFKDKAEPNIASLLPLVAMGSICDIVDLSGVNRVLTSKGIKAIREGSHSIVGIDALCAVSKVSPQKITSGDVAFQLGPRINASSRIDTATTAFRLMMTDSKEEAEQLARELDQYNDERKAIEEELTELAFSMIDTDKGFGKRKTITLASDRFLPAVQGIVASRVTHRFSKPVVIISIEGETAKGSGRSVPAFDLFGGLTACSDHLLKFGGHPMAAGLTIESSRIGAFADALERSAGHLTEDDLRHEVVIDAEVGLGEVSLAECKNLAALEPFGEGHRSPLFCVRNCKVVSAKTLKEKHLKLTLAQDGVPWTVDAIAFGRTADGIPSALDLVFSMEINEWRDNQKPQLMVKDLRGSR